MGVTGCCKFVKYLLVTINFLFWIAGFAAVFLFVWMLTDPSFLISTQSANNYYIGVYFILVVGTLMFIIAFLGCCGAFRESQCMLVGFFCCLLIILVAEVATGAWAYINREKLDEMTRSSAKHTVQFEYDVSAERTQAFDAFQKHFKCCGANGPNDWATSKYNNPKSQYPDLDLKLSSPGIAFRVPKSCCNETVTDIQCSDIVHLLPGVPEPMIYSHGCMDKLVEAVHNNMCTIVGVFIGIICVELLGLILAISLCGAIRRTDHYKS